MVYILQFSESVGGRANFYIGWTKDAYTYISRMKAHLKGNGAAITRAALARGITWQTVVIVHNCTRDDERRFKNRKNTKYLVRALLNKGHCAGL